MPVAGREPRFLPQGDGGLTVEFGDAIEPELNALVLAFDTAVNAEKPAGLIETVPTYRSLLVQFDPLTFDFDAFVDWARKAAATLKPARMSQRRWRVPVAYGGEHGIDLDDVAARHGLTATQVIDLHAAAIYRVYMLGFMPGLAYLGGLDPRLATSRRLDPRAKTSANHVSIGGVQALISTLEMPSGWHILGRTPVRAFAPERDPAFLFMPGDEIVFAPIAADRWKALERAALAGEIVAEETRA